MRRAHQRVRPYGCNGPTVVISNNCNVFRRGLPEACKAGGKPALNTEITSVTDGVYDSNVYLGYYGFRL